MSWHAEDDRVTYVIEQMHPFDDDGKHTVKIGSTTPQRVGNRVAELQTGNPWPLVVRAVLASPEGATRRKVAKGSLLGEWVRIGPRQIRALISPHRRHAMSDYWAHETTVEWHGRGDCWCASCARATAFAKYLAGVEVTTSFSE